MTTKLLDYADLRERGIPWGRCQLWRMWTAGKFPKPIKLSSSKNVWEESAINSWMDQAVRASQTGDAA